MSWTVTPVNNSNSTEQKIASSIDMSSITYLSDGKTLNATLWLNQGFNNTLFRGVQSIDFGIYIDVNPESATGMEGVSFHKQIFWPSGNLLDLPGYVNQTSNKSWIDNIHEVRSGGGHRYLRIEKTKNYTELFEQTQYAGHVYSIPISLDLGYTNFPHKYKALFYVSAYLDDYGDRISDYTNWLDIPPSKFFLSTFPGNLELRPGDSKDFTGILKSTSGSIPAVTNLTIDEKSSIIKVHPSGQSYISSSGVHPATFHIEVPSEDKIQAGEYTIPIAATISTGSTNAPPEFIGGQEFAISANSKGYMNTTANMTIKVLEPLGLGEKFKQIWDVYGQPISIILGGFAGGATTLLFDKLKKKENSPHEDDHQSK